MAELLTINASESAAHSFYAERGSRQDFCLSHSDNGVDNGPLCHAVEAIKPSQMGFYPESTHRCAAGPESPREGCIALERRPERPLRWR